MNTKKITAKKMTDKISKIILSLEDGNIWTEIFDQKQNIVACFLSDNVMDALTKTKEWYSYFGGKIATTLKSL